MRRSTASTMVECSVFFERSLCEGSIPPSHLGQDKQEVSTSVTRFAMFKRFQPGLSEIEGRARVCISWNLRDAMPAFHIVLLPWTIRPRLVKDLSDCHKYPPHMEGSPISTNLLRCSRIILEMSQWIRDWKSLSQHSCPSFDHLHSPRYLNPLSIDSTLWGHVWHIFPDLWRI
jgi:hypothetical protein